MLRTTRQQIEVLASGSTGKLRATRQSVEVLIAVEDPLVVSIEDAMSLGDDATATVIVLPVGPEEVEGIGSDDLEFSDVATFTIDYCVSVIESLDFDDSTVTQAPFYLEVWHVLDFEEPLVGHLGVLHLVVHDTLALQGRAGRTLPLAVHDTISFAQSGLKVNAERIKHVLALSETIVVGKSKAIADRLRFTETIQIHGDFRRPMTEQLNLVHSCTCWIDGPRRFDRQYYPFIGDGDPAAPTPPPLALSGPMVGVTAPFQLVYPSTGDVADSCTLRAPNFGNKDRLSFNRVNRETRGGTLVVYANPIWPKTQTLALSFSALRRSEGLDLLRFFADHLGQEIGVIDWESRYWRGVVTTTTDPVVEDSPDSFSANFEFEGELDPSWMPQIIPVAPGTPRRRLLPGYSITPDPMEPIVPVVPTTESYSVEADESISVGRPIYLKLGGHAALALANAPRPASAIGFAIVAAEPTFAVSYITEGKVTLANWATVAGTAELAAGSTYYLDDSGPGQITDTAPTASGRYVVRVGRAASSTTLDIEIESPIRL